MQSIWAETALLPSGWASNVSIEVDGAGKISAVQADTRAGGQKAGLVLPAPVNAHSHAFQRAMAGLTERRGPNPNDSFWTWRQLMFRFLDRLTPDHIEAITAFVQMEMLEADMAPPWSSTICTTNPAAGHTIILQKRPTVSRRQLIKPVSGCVCCLCTINMAGAISGS